MSEGQTILIVGATGMVGHEVLMHALSRPRVSKVRSLGRRKVQVDHPKR